MLAMSLAHIRIVDIGQSCDLKLSILDPNALLLVREGDYLAVVAVGDEGGAVRAGPVLVEKAGQHVHGDVGRCAANEIDTMNYRKNRMGKPVSGLIAGSVTASVRVILAA